MKMVQHLMHKMLKTIRYQSWRIIVLTFICASTFVIIQNIEEKGLVNDPDNNYGIDCHLFHQSLKDTPEGRDGFTDKKVVFAVQLDAKNGGEMFYMQHRPLLNCMEPDSDNLIDVIRDELLIKPIQGSTKMMVEKKESVEIDNYHQTRDIVDMIFKDKKEGFFIEAGASNCEYSITLPLEYHYRWKGLLVEALPGEFSECKTMGRSSILMNTCLATQDKPHFADFSFSGPYFEKENSSKILQAMSGFLANSDKYKQKHGNQINMSIKFQCFPLYSILLSMGNPTVNLFVLDIEGFELAVLETIPWNKVDIQVLSVETDLAGLFQKDSSREKIINLMDKHGYERFDHRNDFNNNTNKNQNDLFVRRDIVKKYNVTQL